MKILSILCVFALVFFISYSPAYAWKMTFDGRSNELLRREQTWPDWKVPNSFLRFGLNNELIFPDWFQGAWEVESIDLSSSEYSSIKYLVRFVEDCNQGIIGDRLFNSQSIGKAILGSQLEKVVNDPNSFNRQLAFLKGDVALDSKIIYRRDENHPQNNFFADELAFQILYANDNIRISRVETLSHYWPCDSDSHISETPGLFICGEQFQARYDDPGEVFSFTPVNTNHFQLFLSPAMEEDV